MDESEWFHGAIEAAAKIALLPADVIEAIVQVESAGRADAFRFEPMFWERYLVTSPTYRDQNPRRVSASYGLMQVMYPVAIERGYHGEPEGLFVPAVSLEFGCRHLRYLLNIAMKGNMDAAIAAYNGGPAGNFEPPYHNAAYLAKVHAQLAAIRRRHDVG